MLDNSEIQRNIVVSEEKHDVIGAWILTSCQNCMLLAPEWTQAAGTGSCWLFLVKKLQKLDDIGS